MEPGKHNNNCVVLPNEEKASHEDVSHRKDKQTPIQDFPHMLRVARMSIAGFGKSQRTYSESDGMEKKIGPELPKKKHSAEETDKKPEVEKKQMDQRLQKLKKRHRVMSADNTLDDWESMCSGPSFTSYIMDETGNEKVAGSPKNDASKELTLADASQLYAAQHEIQSRFPFDNPQQTVPPTCFEESGELESSHEYSNISEIFTDFGKPPNKNNFDTLDSSESKNKPKYTGSPSTKASKVINNAIDNEDEVFYDNIPTKHVDEFQKAKPKKLPMIPKAYKKRNSDYLPMDEHVDMYKGNKQLDDEDEDYVDPYCEPPPPTCKTKTVVETGHESIYKVAPFQQKANRTNIFEVVPPPMPKKTSAPNIFNVVPPPTTNDDDVYAVPTTQKKLTTNAFKANGNAKFDRLDKNHLPSEHHKLQNDNSGETMREDIYKSPPSRNLRMKQTSEETSIYSSPVSNKTVSVRASVPTFSPNQVKRDQSPRDKTKPDVPPSPKSEVLNKIKRDKSPNTRAKPTYHLPSIPKTLNENRSFDHKTKQEYDVPPSHNTSPKLTKSDTIPCTNTNNEYDVPPSHYMFSPNQTRRDRSPNPITRRAIQPSNNALSPKNIRRDRSPNNNQDNEALLVQQTSSSKLTVPDASPSPNSRHEHEVNTLNDTMNQHQTRPEPPTRKAPILQNINSQAIYDVPPLTKQNNISVFQTSNIYDVPQSTKPVSPKQSPDLAKLKKPKYAPPRPTTSPLMAKKKFNSILIDETYDHPNTQSNKIKNGSPMFPNTVGHKSLEETYDIPPSQINKGKNSSPVIPKKLSHEVQQELYDVPPTQNKALNKSNDSNVAHATVTGIEDKADVIYAFPDKVKQLLLLEIRNDSSEESASDHEYMNCSGDFEHSYENMYKLSKQPKPKTSPVPVVKSQEKFKNYKKGKQKPNKDNNTKLCQSESEFYKYDVNQVVECLSQNGLISLSKVCRAQNLSGEAFRHVPKDELKKAPFNMTFFHVPKLLKLIEKLRLK